MLAELDIQNVFLGWFSCAAVAFNRKMNDLKKKIFLAFGFLKFASIKSPLLRILISSLLLLYDSYLIVKPFLLKNFRNFISEGNANYSWHDAIIFMGLLDIPRFFMGVILFLMAFIVLFRTRVAWFSAISILFCVSFIDCFVIKNNSISVVYFISTIVYLLMVWRDFYKHNLGTISLFALLSIVSLLVYGSLGVLYLGDQFSPHILNVYEAIYFVIVCMSTVGFGDIVPVSDTARIFTVTVIIFGITIFAASIASIAGTMVRNNVKKILHGKIAKVTRNNHCIIIGASYFAQGVCRKFVESGIVITVVCKSSEKNLFPENIDIIEGDPSSIDILNLAGAKEAKYILSLMENDSDNAFILLAAKEVCGEKTKIIALVNDDQNINKIKIIKPDGILSLQELGSEILMQTISGKTDNNSIVNIFLKT